MNELQQKARQMSQDFLENDKEYRLGFIEAEQPNPITARLGETYLEDTREGIKTLLQVDETLVPKYAKLLQSPEFDRFADDVFIALSNGGRIILSGCGSTGRLAMRLEASWRIAARKHPATAALEDRVISLMTGGDYALIRAVESFEDYIQLGKMQSRELSLGKYDILVGITATGETTSILGTATQALEDGASVWMIICTNPSTILGKLKRADDVYTHPACSSLYIPCGGMAVTGSTRMQSSTIEQALIGSALELALAGFQQQQMDKDLLIRGFQSCIDTLRKESAMHTMAAQTELETELYNREGHVTYFAEEYLLDVLADTTERGPTFSVPPFRPQANTAEPLSWAFVKNPSLSTHQAWDDCFERQPRCIAKTSEEYAALGILEKDIRRIPKIDREALMRFEIGCEPDPEREQGNSLATWIGTGSMAPEAFRRQSEKFRSVSTVMLDDSSIEKTRMKLFEHLSMKLMINIISTGTMAKLGRISGNYMVNLKISNKKLIDRASRIVADLCGTSYENANYELFCTKLMLEQEGVIGSETKLTIQRLGRKSPAQP